VQPQPHRVGKGEVDWAAQDRREISLEIQEGEQAEGPLGIDLDQEIDIARRPEVATRRRAEHRQPGQAPRTQLPLVPTQHP
jgi:hypothetical protein